VSTVADTLSIAVGEHQSGRLRRAEQLYHRVLRIDPTHADALHLLGVVSHQNGKHVAAIDYIRRAIEANPDAATYHGNLGIACQAAGQIADAVTSLRRAVQINPDYGRAHNDLGSALILQGRFDEAAAALERAVSLRPDDAMAHANLAAARKAQGELDQAAECYRRAVELKPDHAAAHNGLGTVLTAQGDLEAAEASYRRAIEIAPEMADAHNNLGHALDARDAEDEAEAAFRKALDLNPNFAQAHNNLGGLLQGYDKLEEAEACYRRALEIAPDFTEALANLVDVLVHQDRNQEAIEIGQRALGLDPGMACLHMSLGNAHNNLEDFEEAEACYGRSLKAQPDHAESLRNLGHVLERQGRIEEAVASFRQAVELGGEQPLWELRLLSICPPVFGSNEEIDRYRDTLLAGLQRLAAMDLKLNFAELSAFGRMPPFNLMFHGRDDRPIKEAYADVFRGCFPQETPAPRTGRPRIGFVVTRKHEGIFLVLMGGVLQQMNSDAFDVAIVCGTAGVEEIREAIDSKAIGVVAIPNRIDLAAETIRRANFDLLFYWEVGTDLLNYFLPFFRLAPLQCTSGGMPVTSGIPQMDYYLSHEMMETEQSDDYYSETLIRTRTNLNYVPHPPPPEAVKPREDFGFTADQNVYLCVQKIAKFHPEFDPILAGILRADDAATIAVVEDKHGYDAKALRERLATTIGDVAERIVYLPRQDYDEYVSLLMAADVVLDTIHYCGGSTTYQSLSLGKPIVTMPTPLQAGRSTYACYRRMGVDHCVAETPEQYVEIAVRLGTDAAHRAEVVELIRATNATLFKDCAVADELHRVFGTLIERSRAKAAAGQQETSGNGETP